MSKEEILEIKKEVLIKNNIHWLHVRERAEYQVEEGRVPITDKDLFEIIEIVLNQNK
jgi:rhodanese-related sulfurtransferase